MPGCDRSDLSTKQMPHTAGDQGSAQNSLEKITKTLETSVCPRVNSLKLLAHGHAGNQTRLSIPPTPKKAALPSFLRQQSQLCKVAGTVSDQIKGVLQEQQVPGTQLLVVGEESRQNH